MTTETLGSLLVLGGFLIGGGALVVRSNPNTVDVGQVLGLASIGVVVLGLILAIAGKKRT